MHDVCSGGGEAEHATSPSSQQQPWMRLLDRKRRALQLFDGVMLACERERLAGEEPFDDRQRLFEAIDSDRGGLVRKAGLLLVRDHPASTQARAQAAHG